MVGRARREKMGSLIVRGIGQRRAGKDAWQQVSSVDPEPSRVDSDSKTRLVEAAIAYLDESGVDDFNLRAFGSHVHLHNTAIYAHFPSKAALLAAVFDSLASTPDSDDIANLPPLLRLRENCLALRAALRQHPVLVPAFIESTRTPGLRSGSSLLASAVEAFAEIGVHEELRLESARMLETFVLGTSFYDFAAAPGHLDQRSQRHLALHDTAMDGAARTPADVDATNEAAFIWGLDALLRAIQEAADAPTE